MSAEKRAFKQEAEKLEEVFSEELQRSSGEQTKEVGDLTRENDQLRRELIEAKHTLLELRIGHKRALDELTDSQTRLVKLESESKRTVENAQWELSSFYEKHAAEVREWEDGERAWKEDAERLGRELARVTGELADSKESETELNERLADAEYRIEKGSEMVRRLNDELRELRFRLG